MAEYMSDSPNQSAPAGPASNQRTPSSGHNKRNNRNRKNNPQVDGAVSDGAIVNPASPRAKQAQAHHQRQSVAGPRAVSIPQNGNNNMGKINGQKPRPVSMGGNLIPATPAKEAAYAASAFQASPAPASLPMPKFFSKSVPNAAEAAFPREQVGNGRPNGHTSSPESDNTSPAPPPREAQSPLDLFFKADRAEKERLRNGSASMSPNSGSRFAPPPAGHMNGFQHSGKSIFMQELDGDDTDMPSPRTIPPTNRPPTNRQHSSPAVAPKTAASDQERQAHTKALKDQLFNIAGTPPRDHSRGSSGSQTPEGIFGSPSPFQRPASGPSTPQPSSDQLQSQYSLHYNNRVNLSPLFQKARADTPPRQSGLRQEIPSDAVSNADSAVDVHPHPPSIDPQTFARSYLKEQIRTSGPAEMPHLPWNNGPPPAQYPGRNASSGPVPIPVQPIRAQHGVPQSTTPRANGSKDIKGMEDDLRKMLKINNVLG